MPDDNKVFRIRIEGEASSLKGAANEGAAALKGLGQSAEVTSEHVDKATLSHKQLHKVVHGLSMIAPELGMAFQAMVNPITGAIMASFFVMDHFKKQIEAVDETLSNLNEQEFAKHVERLQEQRMAMVNASLAVHEFKAKLEEAAHAQQTVNERMAESVGDIKQRYQFATELAEAEKDARLAALDAFHAAGIGSEAEYQATRIEIERQANEERRRNALAEQAIELAAKKVALNDAKAAQDGLESKATAASLEASKTKAEADRKKKAADDAPRRLEESRKAADEYGKKINTGTKSIFDDLATNTTNEEVLKAVRFGDAGFFDESDITIHDGRNVLKQFREYKSLQVDIYQANKRNNQAAGQFEVSQAAAQDAALESEKAKQRALEGDKFINQNERETKLESDRWERQRLQDMKLNAAGNQQSAAQTYAAEGKTPFGHIVQESSFGAWAVQHGGQVTQEQAYAVQQLQSVLGANRMQMRQLLQVLGQHAQDQDWMTKEIETLKAQNNSLYNQ